jgi:glutamyl-tRNA(Gln) amidotransferase subunit D
VESGVIVAIAPQTLEGRINMEVYSAGRMLFEAGVIGQGADWLPETAYAKLSWALGQQHDAARVAKLMMTPIAGDISPRSPLPASSEESSGA